MLKIPTNTAVANTDACHVGATFSRLDRGAGVVDPSFPRALIVSPTDDCLLGASQGCGQIFG